MTEAERACPVGAVCLSCRATEGLRVRVDGSPAGDICWTACKSCAVSWVPLRLTLDATVGLARDHREHLGLPRFPERAAPPAPRPITPPAVLTDRRRAADLLDRYFRGVQDDRGPLHVGGMFEQLGGGGDRPEVRDFITTEDLVAVSMLGSPVPARAALAILGEAREHVARHLVGIPADVDLVDADDGVIGGGSTADLLQDVLVQLPGVGPVTAGKILARKRPRLVPVVDGTVLRTLAHPGPGYWRDLRHLLQADGRHVHNVLTDLLGHVGLDDQVSALRAFEVLVRLGDRRTDEDNTLIG